MKTREKNIKEVVKSKYNQIALQSKEKNEKSCCGSGTCCDTIDYVIFSDDYSQVEGYVSDADLSLGCGMPTEFARISVGDTVLDLGSGAGNDCFVVRSIVGETGKVIGLDFAPNMLKKARENAAKLGYTNVEFIKGDIEQMPIESNTVDVIVSNCVLNLVPEKETAFKNMSRVLKHDGHFCVSDIVLRGHLPEKLVNDVAMYAGCVSGAIQKEEYLEIVKKAGFKNISVKKEKEINIPDELLLNYLDKMELEDFRNNGLGICSITVYAEK